MPKPFNLTAQLNIVGPTNLRPVVNNLRKQLSGITTSVKVDISRSASRNVSILNKSVQNLTKSLQQANSQASTLSGTMSKLGATIRNIGSSTGKATSGLTSVSNSANQVGKSVQQAATQMEEFGRISGLALRRYAGFTVATTLTFGFTRAVSNALGEAVKFERELIKISQVTGKSMAGLKSLTAEIGRLSTALGTSSTELLEVSRILSQAGLRANEVKRALDALAKSTLAPTFNDIRNTTEGVIAAMSQFGIKAKDVGKVLGSLNAVAGKFAVESEDLISVIRRTGGVFKAASGDIGSPIKQLNELIAVFTSVRSTTRESAESIATGLRTIFTRIQRPTTLKFLRQLGVDLQDLEGKFVGPFKAMQLLNTALKELDPRDVRFAKIVEQLGGFRQVGKLIPAIQQFGKAQAALGVAMAGQGSLAKDAATAQQSLLVQTAKVREEFLKLFRDIAGDSTFQVFAKGALQLASSLIKLADSFRPVLPILAAIGAIKGASALKQFGTGFFGGIRSAGGAQAAGAGIAGSVTGTGSQQASQALVGITKANTAALQSNTKAIALLSGSIKNLTRVVASRGFGGGAPRIRPRLGGQIYPRKFASGGFVPGTGNYDSVPAMLTPGEFVVKKSAAKSLGADYLNRANRYASGGNVFSVNNKPRYGLFAFQRATKSIGTKEVIRKISKDGIKGKAVDKIWEQHSSKIKAANQGITLDKFKEGKAPYASNVSGTPNVRYLDAGVEKTFVKSVKENFDNFTDNIIKDAMGARTQKMAVAFNANPESLKKSIKTNMQPSTIAGNAFEGFISGVTGNVRKEAKTSEAQSRFDFSPNEAKSAFDELFGPGAGSIPNADAKLTVTSNTLKDMLNKALGSGTNESRYFSPSVKDQEKLDKSSTIRSRMMAGRANMEEKRQGRDVQQPASGAAPRIRGFNRGGSATGSDTVPALLTPGEFVVNRESASRIGLGNLIKMNRGEAAGYASGGLVTGSRHSYGMLRDPQRGWIEQARRDREAKRLRRERAGGGGGGGMGRFASGLGTGLTFAGPMLGNAIGGAGGAAVSAGTGAAGIGLMSGGLAAGFAGIAAGAILAKDAFDETARELEMAEVAKKAEAAMDRTADIIEKFGDNIASQMTRILSNFAIINAQAELFAKQQQERQQGGIVQRGMALLGVGGAENDLGEEGLLGTAFNTISDFFTGGNRVEQQFQQTSERRIRERQEVAAPGAAQGKDVIRRLIAQENQNLAAEARAAGPDVRPDFAGTQIADSDFASQNKEAVQAVLNADRKYIESKIREADKIKEVKEQVDAGTKTAAQGAAEEARIAQQEQRIRENRTNSILSQIEEEEDARAKIEASATQLNKTLDMMVKRFSTMAAVASRVSRELDNSNKAMNQQVAAAQGQAGVDLSGFGFSDVFSNTAAFSPGEISQSLGQFGTSAGLSGSANFTELSSIVSSSANLSSQIPGIIQDSLNQAGGALGAEFNNVLEENLLQATGGNANDPLFKDLINAITSGQADRGGEAGEAFIEGLSNKALETLSQRADLAGKAMEELAKTFDKQMQAFGKAINTQAKLIENSVRSQERVNQIRFRQQQQMAELTGGELSLDQLFAPLESQVSALTGGVLDPNQIGNMNAQAQRDLQSQNEQMRPGKTPEQLAALGTAAANTAATINMTRSALELLASDTSRQSAIVQKLNKLNEARSGAKNVMEAILTGDPQELMKLTRGLNLTAANQSGMLNTSQIGNEDRAQLFNITRMLQPFAGADAGFGIDKDQFSIGNLIGGMAGDFGLGGGPMAQNFLNLASSNVGESTKEQVLLEKLRALNQEQLDAADRLARMDRDIAERQAKALEAMPLALAAAMKDTLDRVLKEGNMAETPASSPFAPTPPTSTPPASTPPVGTPRPFSGPADGGPTGGFKPAGQYDYSSISGSGSGTQVNPYKLSAPDEMRDDRATLRPGEFGVTPDGEMFEGFNKGGRANKKAQEKLAGKLVPGVGNTDKIAALLTPQEYVVNAQASTNNRAVLDTINNLGASRKFRLVAANQGGAIGLNGGGVAGTGLKQIESMTDKISLIKLRGAAERELINIDAWASKKSINSNAIAKMKKMSIGYDVGSPKFRVSDSDKFYSKLLDERDALNRTRPRGADGKFLNTEGIATRRQDVRKFKMAADNRFGLLKRRDMPFGENLMRNAEATAQEARRVEARTAAESTEAATTAAKPTVAKPTVAKPAAEIKPIVKPTVKTGGRVKPTVTRSNQSLGDIRKWMKKGSGSLGLKGLPADYVDQLSDVKVRKVYDNISRTTREGGKRAAVAQNQWYQLSRNARKGGFRPSFSAGGARAPLPDEVFKPAVRPAPKAPAVGDPSLVKPKVTPPKAPAVGDPSLVKPKVTPPKAPVVGDPSLTPAARQAAEVDDLIRGVEFGGDTPERPLQRIGEDVRPKATGSGMPDIDTDVKPKVGAKVKPKAGGLGNWWRAFSGKEGNIKQIGAAIKPFWKTTAGTLKGVYTVGKYLTGGVLAPGLKIGGGAIGWGGKKTLGAMGSAYDFASDNVSRAWGSYLDDLAAQGVFGPDSMVGKAGLGWKTSGRSGGMFKNVMKTLGSETLDGLKGLTDPSVWDDIMRGGYDGPSRGQAIGDSAKGVLQKTWQGAKDTASFLKNSKVGQIVGDNAMKGVQAITESVPGKTVSGVSKGVKDVATDSVKAIVGKGRSVSGAVSAAAEGGSKVAGATVKAARFGSATGSVAKGLAKGGGRFALKALPFIGMIPDIYDSVNAYQAHKVALDKVAYDGSVKKALGDFGYVEGPDGHIVSSGDDAAMDLAGGGQPMRPFDEAEQNKWMIDAMRPYLGGTIGKVGRIAESVMSFGATDLGDAAARLMGDTGRYTVGKEAVRIADENQFMEVYGRAPNGEELARIKAGNEFYDKDIKASGFMEVGLRARETAQLTSDNITKSNQLPLKQGALEWYMNNIGAFPSTMKPGTFTTYFGNKSVSDVHKMFSLPSNTRFSGDVDHVKNLLATGKWEHVGHPEWIALKQFNEGDGNELSTLTGYGRGALEAINAQLIYSSNSGLSTANSLDSLYNDYKKIVDGQQATIDYFKGVQQAKEQATADAKDQVHSGNSEMLKRFGLPESFAKSVQGTYNTPFIGLPKLAERNQKIYDWMRENFSNSEAQLGGGSSMPTEAFEGRQWKWNAVETSGGVLGALASKLPLTDSETGNTIRSQSIYNTGSDFPMEIWPFVQEFGSHYERKLQQEQFAEQIKSRLGHVQSFNPNKNSIQLSAAPPDFVSQLQTQPRDAMDWVKTAIDNLVQKELMTESDKRVAAQQKAKGDATQAARNKEEENIRLRQAGTRFIAGPDADQELLSDMRLALVDAYGGRAGFSDYNLQGYNEASLRDLEKSLRYQDSGVYDEVKRGSIERLTAIGNMDAVRAEEFKYSLPGQYDEWVKKYAAELPKLKSGGWISGKSHAAGGTIIEAEDGEFMISKDKAAPPEIQALLQAINSGSFTADDIQMPSYGDVIDNMDSVFQTYGKEPAGKLGELYKGSIPKMQGGGSVPLAFRKDYDAATKTSASAELGYTPSGDPNVDRALARQEKLSQKLEADRQAKAQKEAQERALEEKRAKAEKIRMDRLKMMAEREREKKAKLLRFKQVRAGYAQGSAEDKQAFIQGGAGAPTLGPEGGIQRHGQKIVRPTDDTGEAYSNIPTQPDPKFRLPSGEEVPFSRLPRGAQDSIRRGSSQLQQVQAPAGGGGQPPTPQQMADLQNTNNFTPLRPRSGAGAGGAPRGGAPAGGGAGAGGAGGAGADFSAFAQTMETSAVTLSTMFEQFNGNMTTITEAANIFDAAATKIHEAAQSLASLPEKFTHEHDVSVSVSNDQGFAQILGETIKGEVAREVFALIEPLLPGEDAAGNPTGPER